MSTPTDKMREAASQVPLVDLLRGVPRAARLLIDSEDGMSTRHIPVGRLCHEAATALSTLPAPAPEAQAVEALRAIMRAADAAKEPCSLDDPESPAAIRNGKFATIAAMAAQGLGLVRGPAAQPAAQQAPAVPQGWRVERGSDERDKWVQIFNADTRRWRRVYADVDLLLYRFLSAMLDAAPQPPAAGWQSMRKAPKDGTAVLVLVEGSDIPRAARWLRGTDDPHATEDTAGPGWHLTWDGTPIAQHDGPRYWMHCPDDPDDAPQAPAAPEGE